MDGERKVRIGNLEAIAVVAFAFLFDVAQFIWTLLTVTIILAPVGFALGLITGFAGYMALFLVFKLAFKGVQVFGGKSGNLKILGAFGAAIVELAPFLQALPALTGFALTIVIATRIEDTLGDASSLERLVVRRNRERGRMDRKQDKALEAARKRDDRRGDNKTKAEDRQQKRNQQETRTYERRVMRQNIGMVGRAAFGIRRSDRLSQNRAAIEERNAAPGMLQEDSLQEDGLSGFNDRALEKMDA